MTPRILFVTHTSALGGAELYLRDIAVQLRDHCAVVLFESGPLQTELIEREVPVYVLPLSSNLERVRKTSGIGAGLRAIPEIIRLVRRLVHIAGDYDLVYANSQKSLIVGALAAQIANRPAVWNLHDVLTADHFSPFNRWLATFWANLMVDLVVCNSAATEDAFRASGGRTPTATVYNGFDPALFDAVSSTEVEQVRASLGLPDAPIVGVYSRLAAWKGQHVLLDALPSLPGVHALLVGDALFGPDETYATSLRRQARDLGVTERVHFLGFRTDVPLLMKAADIVVHTSVAAEPFGRVLVEGMLANRPVVATRAGGALEIITDGVNGLLVSPGDSEALAHRLRALLAHPDRARHLAQRGTETARSRFSITAAADQIDALGRSVVASTS